MPQAYIIARKCDIISKIYHPFHKERISLKNDKFLLKLVVFLGAGVGTRTPTLEAREPKSRMSTNSITPAYISSDFYTGRNPRWSVSLDPHLKYR